MKTLALACLVAGFATCAQAGPPDFNTGNGWYEDCAASKNTGKPKDPMLFAFKSGMCLAAARTAGDTALFLKVVDKDFPTCLSKEVTTMQIVDVGMAFVKANPKTRHDSAAANLLLAIKEAWPCEDEGEKS